MPLATIAAFWVTSLLFVITPGADWAYAISAGVRGRVAAAVSGLLIGHLVATVVVAAGIGPALARVPHALAIMTLAGAGYLIWLGVGILRQPPAPRVSEQPDPGSRWSWFVRGAGVSGLNPKVFLLFLALLPQFTSTANGWPLGLQLGTLGLLHTATCAVVYLAVGFGSRVVLAARPRAARIVSRVSGAAMIVIGIVLLCEQLIRSVAH